MEQKKKQSHLMEKKQNLVGLCRLTAVHAKLGSTKLHVLEKPISAKKKITEPTTNPAMLVDHP